MLSAAEVEATWAGLRPGSCDSKPYLGAAPGFHNLIVATGHKRAGLQLAPATAELIADLVLGRATRLDISAFRLDREPELAGDERSGRDVTRNRCKPPGSDILTRGNTDRHG